MKSSNPTRLVLTVAMSAALAATSFASHAQPGSDVSSQHKAEAQQHKQEKQDEKDDKKAHQQQKRLSQQQQQERIRQQEKLLVEYNQRIAEQQAIALRNAQQLELT
jgi:Ni/Co efflux regulator RcnB